MWFKPMASWRADWKNFQWEFGRAATKVFSRMQTSCVCFARRSTKAGGQSSWARREHIDRTMLNKILNGRKPITKKIIRALKLCNVYAFDDD